MMINPASILKLKNAKKQFEQNHPKFIAFWNTVTMGEIEEDTVIEVTVTKPGQKPIASNIKLRRSDVELLQELKNIMPDL